MATRYARGDRAWGICQRCGQRGRLNAMPFDEQYPNLRVHLECWDPRHPQERLRPVHDPIALWRPSPEEYPYTSPFLELEQASPGAPASLTWTAATSPVMQFNGYRLYRSLNEGEYELLATFPIVRDDFGGILTETLSYEDETAFEDGDALAYYVVAWLGDPSIEHSPGYVEAVSNIVAIDWEEQNLVPPVISAVVVECV